MLLSYNSEMMIHNFASIEIFMEEVTDNPFCFRDCWQELILKNLDIGAMAFSFILNQLLMILLHLCQSLLPETLKNLPFLFILKVIIKVTIGIGGCFFVLFGSLVSFTHSHSGLSFVLFLHFLDFIRGCLLHDHVC